MKFNIHINQKFLAEVVPQISFDEVAVLDYIKGLCGSENKNIEAMRRDGYREAKKEMGGTRIELVAFRTSSERSTTELAAQTISHSA